MGLFMTGPICNPMAHEASRIFLDYVWKTCILDIGSVRHSTHMDSVRHCNVSDNNRNLSYWVCICMVPHWGLYLYCASLYLYGASLRSIFVLCLTEVHICIMPHRVVYLYCGLRRCICTVPHKSIFLQCVTKVYLSCASPWSAFLPASLRSVFGMCLTEVHSCTVPHWCLWLDCASLRSVLALCLTEVYICTTSHRSQYTL